MIDVIIPTQSRPELLQDLVERIKATADYPHRVVYTGKEVSAAANRNLGLLRSGGDQVVMLDDDVTPLSLGWLQVIAEALARPEVVMVSAQLYDLPFEGSYRRPGYMTGLQDWGGVPKGSGETVVPTKRLLTACCAFKPCGLWFDEGYVGSGFEDTDYCNQLALARPDGVFLICHDAHVEHRNHQRNQTGQFWGHNKARYESKWGRIETPEELKRKHLPCPSR